jgi:hypothetical protein
MVAVTLAVYISWGNWPLPGMSLVLGVFGGMLGWILLTLVTQHFITIERANPVVYRELHSRFAILDTRVMHVFEQLNQLGAQRTSVNRGIGQGEESEEEIYFTKITLPRLQAAAAELDRYRWHLGQILGDREGED